jgi:aerobic-type carbon monoxide dehydrogenase small subunit (CoxS/CutS family)
MLTSIHYSKINCYLINGQISKALLDRNPQPTDDDVRKATDGNFCRCGSYPNIIKATLDASKKIAHE